MSEDQAPSLLTGEEAAEWLGVTTETLYPLLSSQEVPGGRKIGREWRVSAEKLAKWFDGPEATELPTVYSAAHLAQKLRVPKQTVWRLLRSGTIPSRKVGRAYAVSEQQLRSYLEV
jgi:excisionase family DNA binding protein